MKKLIIFLVFLILGSVMILLISFYSKSESLKESEIRSYVNKNTTVYVVGGASKGDYYHKEGCPYFRTIFRGKTIYPLDVATAQNLALIPCPTCNPPIPLRSEKENKDLIKSIESEQKREESERQKAALEFLNGKSNPKYIQSMEFIPVENPSASDKRAIEDIRKNKQLIEGNKNKK